MKTFLVETYAGRGEAQSVDTAGARAARAATQVAGTGRPIAYLRSFYIPKEETLFQLYEAASAELVEEAARLAGITTLRVTEVVDLGE